MRQRPNSSHSLSSSLRGATATKQSRSREVALDRHGPRDICCHRRHRKKRPGSLPALLSRHSQPDQWLIIQGRAEGKLFAPFAAVAVFFDDFPEQQEQPAPCADERFGSCDARSLTPIALRRPASMPASRGAVRIARGASVPQSGQSHGSRYSDIARTAVNGPHASQRYS